MSTKMPENPEISLQEAADRLGVHYMTAYRYVRLGKLPATKEGNTWHVRVADVEAFGTPAASAPVPDWPTRLEDRLLAGDEPGAWGIIEAALASGAEPRDIYVEGLAPALRSIGARWAAGEIEVALEHRASLISARMVGRISPRFVTRGRRRGTIVLGSATGDAHYLGGTMLADLLRLHHFHVDDLGANPPIESFEHAVEGSSDVVAAGVSAFKAENDENVAAAIAAIKAAKPLPVFVGGPAIADQEHAVSLGADGYAATADEAVELFVEAVK